MNLIVFKLGFVLLKLQNFLKLLIKTVFISKEVNIKKINEVTEVSNNFVRYFLVNNMYALSCM